MSVKPSSIKGQNAAVASYTKCRSSEVQKCTTVLLQTAQTIDFYLSDTNLTRPLPFS